MTARERISRILHALEETGEDLLALSDDIWEHIDHNDTEAMQQGVAFKVEFNGELAAFQKLSDRIRDLISRQEGLPLEEVEKEKAAGEVSIDETDDGVVLRRQGKDPVPLDEFLI